MGYIYSWIILAFLSSTQACIDGSMDMVAFLLERSANVNQIDNEGWTPLHVAASCGYPEIAEYVLYVITVSIIQQHHSCVIQYSLPHARMQHWCQSISLFNNTNTVVVFGSTTSQLKHEWACLAHKCIQLKWFNKCKCVCVNEWRRVQIRKWAIYTEETFLHFV